MVKKLAIGAAAIVLALVGLLVGRTMMVQPLETSGGAPVLDAAFDAKLMSGRLAEAVRFRTISWGEGASTEDIEASQKAFVAFREWIAMTYPAFSKVAKLEVVGGYSLLFTWEGSDPSLKPALFMSHMDVVPVAPGSEAQWKHAPFDGVVAEDHVWGRGTLDTKAGIIGQLEAAEALAASGAQPKRTLMFSFGHDEELGGLKGNAETAALLKSRNIELEFVNDEGGAITKGVVPGVEQPVALIGVAEKGFLSLQLKALSPGGHSSLPVPVSETAIGRLANALRKIEGAPFESRIDGISREFLTQLMPAMKFMPRLTIANLWLFEPLVIRSMNATPGSAASIHTTIAPTIIKGGMKENVLPPDATLVINFRIHPRDTTHSVEEHIRDVVDDEQVEITVYNPGRDASPVSDMAGPQYALLKSVLEKVKPGVIVAPNLVSGGTDAKHFQPLTRNVFRIVPIELTADDLKGFHGTNERVPVSSLPLVASFYLELFRRLDQPLAKPAG